MSTTSYLKLFFEKGKIIFNDQNKVQNKKLFNSVLKELHAQHPQFIEQCTRENILRIDDQLLIIELTTL